MKKITITVPVGKPRNPFHSDLRRLGQKIVLAKKGKGSYNRKKMKGDTYA